MNLEQAIKLYESASKLAEAINVSQSAVSKWKERGKISLIGQLRIYYASRHKLELDQEYQDKFAIVQE